MLKSFLTKLRRFFLSEIIENQSKLIEAIGNQIINLAENQSKIIEAIENQSKLIEIIENGSIKLIENQSHSIKDQSVFFENLLKQIECQTGRIEYQSEQLENLSRHTENQTSKIVYQTEQLENLSRHTENQTSKIVYQTEHIENQSKHLENQTSKIVYQTEHIENQSKHLEYQTSKIVYQTEHIENQSKHLEYQTSKIVYQTEQLENQLKHIANITIKIDNLNQEVNELKVFLGLLNYNSAQQIKNHEKEDETDENKTLHEKSKDLMAFHLIDNIKIRFDFSQEAYQKALSVFDLLTPMDVLGKRKVRLGSEFDGGYITIEPETRQEKDGIAYSFGISTYDPWSLEMVERGYNVFQYDGTIENGPYNHPMIHFFKYMITGSSRLKKNEKNIRQILKDNNHYDKNIMVNIDIEGGEWDLFESITNEEIMHFEQIIVEFHGFLPSDDKITKKMEILKKINETHQCIHIHANNGACPNLATILLGFRQFPFLIEATYLRKDPSYEFVECLDEFPGNLDSPNGPFLPDMYLGFFNKPQKRTDTIDENI